MSIPATMIGIIAASVDTMSISAGDNFDYGPVDIHDPAARVYPQVFLEYTDEAPAGVQMAGHTTQALPLTFRALIALGSGNIDAEVGKVLVDIKRLIDALQTPLSTVGLLYIETVSAKWKPRLVRAFPAELSVIVNLVYRQSRANPASP